MPSFDLSDFPLVNDTRIEKKENLIASCMHVYMDGCWYNWLI